MWHRCEQPVGHTPAVAPAQPGWRAGTARQAPVCHMQNSCVPGGARSSQEAGTAPLVSPQQHGPAWARRAGGELWLCPSGSSVQATNTNISDFGLGRASCQPGARPVTPLEARSLQDLSRAPRFQQRSGPGGGQGCVPCSVPGPGLAELPGKHGQLFLWGWARTQAGRNPNIWICFLANCPAGKFGILMVVLP